MKRQFLTVLALSILCMAASPAAARGPSARAGHDFGHGNGHGFGHGFGRGSGFGGIGFGGGYDCGWDIAEVYRDFYNTLPFFALPPPVYYSCPVPRTYGYSPFAYGPDVMTPEVVMDSKPVTIMNPYVPAAPADSKTDRAASASNTPEPLVIVNPFVTTAKVAQSGS